MDVYDTALTQSSDSNQNSSQSSSSTLPSNTTVQTKQSDEKQVGQEQLPSLAIPTLEQEVQQLVGGITSWWSGISKKSQESLAQAQSHIQSQGGILNLAKKELSHFESQLTSAQGKARTQAFPTVERKDQTDETVPSDKGKGKARAADVEEESQEKAVDSDAQVVDATALTEAHQHQEGTINLEESTKLAIKEARNAANAAGTFFTKLAADAGPRISNLQKQLQSSLNSAVNTKSVDESVNEVPKSPTNVSQTLSSLTSTLQKQLPHLDWNQSQQLAKKYLNATEQGVRDAGKEMRSFLGELVQVVPEDGKTLEEHQGVERSDVGTIGKGTETAARKTLEEEVFAWDEKDGEERKSKKKEVVPAASTPLQKEVESATRPPTDLNDEDEDDDWE